MLAGVILAVLIGGSLQRVSGMGMGLVVAPSATLLLGPVAGVSVSNAVAIVAALLILRAMWDDVDWARFLRLAPLITLGSVLGALAVGAVRSAWLDILVGATVLIALGSLLLLRSTSDLSVRGLGPVAGLAAGFMNTTAGVAAPAMTAYALATRWAQRSFAATLQPIFLLANLLSLGTKVAVGAGPSPQDVPRWAWPLLVATVLVAVGLGTRLATVISSPTARRLAITVALVGGAAALTRGLLTI